MTIEELKEKTIEELKALAYDQITSIENAKNNLGILNQLIKTKIEKLNVQSTSISND